MDTADDRTVTRSAAAAPAAVSALLADPRRPPDLDGSGSLDGCGTATLDGLQERFAAAPGATPAPTR